MQQKIKSQHRLTEECWTHL